MEIELDTERFDELQLCMLTEIIKSVRDGLREAGVEDAQALFEATGNICFAVCAILDGSREMRLDDEPVVPMLTFAKERNGRQLVAAEGGSWMHEYVFGSVEEVFSEDDDS